MNNSGITGGLGGRIDPSLARAAFEHVRKGDNFVQAADEALKAVLASKASETDAVSPTKIDANGLKSVPLTPPSAEAKEALNSEGTLTFLLGQLMALMGEVSISQLEARLDAWKAMVEANKALSDKISSDFQSAAADAEKAMDSYQDALEELRNIKQKQEAQSKVLQSAQEKLSKLKPGDSGYQEALASVEQASKEAESLQKQSEAAEQKAMSAHADATEKAEKADKILTQSQGLNLPRSQNEQNAEDNLTSVARMTMLMSMFVQLVGKNSEESLKADLDIFKALQEGRQKEMETKAAEYAKEVQKAEEVNRIMGCVGKIVGALLTIASIVGAVFSGGASLALAAAGVALMVADEVTKAATGTSFIQQALNPIMENILKPLMQAIGKALSDVLGALGVDKKTADLVGSILGAVLAAVAMVAVIAVVAVVGKGAASKLGDMMSKLLGESIKKLMPTVLRQLASNGSKVLSQGMQRLTNGLGELGAKAGLKADALSKELIGNTINKTVLGLEVAHTGAQSTGNITQGVFLKNSTEALADFTVAKASNEQIQMWLREAVEKFSNDLKVTQELQQMLSAAAQNSAETARAILRQSRA
ncbi:type III secretion system translocon subunit SctE (plasmid) [Providencia sp. PROV188]|uniref:type III secretion system translocon subunit SctE n=2 Tax=Enterobacterales TaxID=91347 RepID=UPI0012B66D13|nr:MULTISPECIES: type III secretion system translocon subunit SctE [Providencia]MTC48140.1 YopB/SseC family type III secretion system translocon subunit [Providencia alcalifaciens]UNJ79548.1 Cell invasion protein SipB [Providencia sp.]WBM62667.1 type III secretion system translocon subunit SctE [Providencia sp. PROV188]